MWVMAGVEPSCPFRLVGYFGFAVCVHLVDCVVIWLCFLCTPCTLFGYFGFAVCIGYFGFAVCVHLVHCSVILALLFVHLVTCCSGQLT